MNRDKKRVIVEGRCTISKEHKWVSDKWREWHNSRRYVNEKIAQMAVDQLNRNSVGIWEYRIKPNQESVE